MNVRAFWDDGHQVSIPGKILAELENAWRGAQSWRIARKVADPLAGDTAYLDHLEQHLLEEVTREAAKRGRALLTNSGPLWTVWPAALSDAGGPADFDEATAGYEWTRGARLPFAGDAVWLMCRMSGLSIPLLPEVKP